MRSALSTGFPDSPSSVQEGLPLSERVHQPSPAGAEPWPVVAQPEPVADQSDPARAETAVHAEILSPPKSITEVLDHLVIERADTLGLSRSQVKFWKSV